jgi:hypothetical protein
MDAILGASRCVVNALPDRLDFGQRLEKDKDDMVTVRPLL